MEKAGLALFGVVMFAGSVVACLAVTDRLNHVGSANIPVVSSFFPEQTAEVSARHIVGESVMTARKLLMAGSISMPAATVTHPDAIRAVFHPRSESGKRTARIRFQFSYSVLPEDQALASDSINANWAEATAASRRVLKTRNVRDLQATDEIEHLKQNLIKVLNEVLFARSNVSPRATVTEITWKDWLLQ